MAASRGVNLTFHLEKILYFEIMDLIDSFWSSDSKNEKSACVWLGENEK